MRSSIIWTARFGFFQKLIVLLRRLNIRLTYEILHVSKIPSNHVLMPKIPDKENCMHLDVQTQSTVLSSFSKCDLEPYTNYVDKQGGEGRV